MPVYPVRLGKELYERLCERARQENCPLASLFRQSADAILGSPPINIRLASINEKMDKLSCIVENNRFVLTFIAANLMNTDRERLERILADYDAKMLNHRIPTKKIYDTSRDFPDEKRV